MCRLRRQCVESGPRRPKPYVRMPPLSSLVAYAVFVEPLAKQRPALALDLAGITARLLSEELLAALPFSLRQPVSGLAARG